MEYGYSDIYGRLEKGSIRDTGNCIALALILYVLIAAFGGAVCDYLSYIAGFGTVLRQSGVDAETVSQLFSTLKYILSLMIPFAVYVLVLRMPLSAALPAGRGNPAVTAGSIFVGAGFAVVSAYTVLFIELLLGIFGVELFSPASEMPESPSAFAVYCISTTLVAAIFEEALFRGAILQSLRRFGDVFAILVSAFVFGLFHLNLVQMPYAFIMGVVMGFFVVRSGSIWAGVAIHFVNNASVLATEIIGKYCGDRAMYLTDAVYKTVVLFGCAVAVTMTVREYPGIFRFAPSGCVNRIGKRLWYILSSPVMVIMYPVAILIISRYVKAGG